MDASLFNRELQKYKVNFFVCRREENHCNFCCGTSHCRLYDWRITTDQDIRQYFSIKAFWSCLFVCSMLMRFSILENWNSNIFQSCVANRTKVNWQRQGKKQGLLGWKRERIVLRFAASCLDRRLVQCWIKGVCQCDEKSEFLQILSDLTSRNTIMQHRIKGMWQN